MRRIVLVGGLAALSVAAVLAFLLAPAPSLSADALAHSVTREADGDLRSDLVPCKRRGGDRWICTIVSANGSDVSEYRVDMTGSRCWRAELVFRKDETESTPAQLEGCVRVRDQVRPVNRLL